MSEESIDSAAAPDSATVPAPPRAWVLAWLHEGARSLVFRAPRWDRLQASPLILAFLLAFDIAASIGIERILNGPGVTFEWRSVTTGWASLLLLAWACYALRPRAGQRASTATAPDAAHLMSLLMAQAFWITLIYGAITVPLHLLKLQDQLPFIVRMTGWLLPAILLTLAMLVAMVRSGDRSLPRQLAGVYGLALACLISYFGAPAQAYWEPAATQAETETGQAEEEPLVFDQELIEAQSPLLARSVAALKPQRPGVIDMYTLTFAPFEGEEVFRRESRMVSEVMAQRFDAAGRNLQLLNHREHLANMPWATPLNLRRALASVAGVMDKDEDILFIHMTSHGASDGQMATNFWPLSVNPITPRDLRKWLDEAGIRHRVLSISACYSGSWIAPLANEDTLVMTASDAEHTSYGCGKLSPLTFFGRAMYDEQLRTSTRSFEQAHAAARKVIDRREKEAGKDDGYSNPQIKVGSRIAPYLARLRERLEN